MPNVKLSDKTTRTAASISDETITYFVGIEIDGSPELLKMSVPQLRTLLGIGGVSDGDKGDIVISSAGTVYTIDSGVLSAYGRTLAVTANPAAARGVLGLGTSATLNVGTSANNVVQLDGTSKLPAVDGSQLTGLPGAGSAITALTGNVTASGPGSAVATIANDAITTAKILNNAVTYGKMNAADAVSRLVGSNDTTTALTNITLGTNLSMSGSTLNATGGGGTPGGSNTHVQFNNSGAFGGAAGLTWDGTNLAATNLRVGDGTLGAPSLAFTSDADGTGTGLYRSAANEIAVAINGVRQVNLSGATAGTGAIRLNNTYTDPSNYERGAFQWATNVLQIGTEAAGTGIVRNLALAVGGVTRLTITPTAFVGLPEIIGIACSDETTTLTTGTAKVTFRMPFAMTLTGVRASVTTAPTGGTLLTVDINEAGVSLLSTKLTFDASEKTTTTAATAAVISDSALADDAEITIDIDAVGSTIAGAGLKVWLIGTRA